MFDFSIFEHALIEVATHHVGGCAGGDTSLASSAPGAAKLGVEDPEGFFDQDLA